MKYYGHFLTICLIQFLMLCELLGGHPLPLHPQLSMTARNISMVLTYNMSGRIFLWIKKHTASVVISSMTSYTNGPTEKVCNNRQTDAWQEIKYWTLSLQNYSRSAEWISLLASQSHRTVLEFGHIPEDLERGNINQYLQNRRSIPFLILWKNRIFITPSFRVILLDSHSMHQSPRKRQLV